MIGIKSALGASALKSMSVKDANSSNKYSPLHTRQARIDNGEATEGTNKQGLVRGELGGRRLEDYNNAEGDQLPLSAFPRRLLKAVCPVVGCGKHLSRCI